MANKKQGCTARLLAAKGVPLATYLVLLLALGLSAQFLGLRGAGKYMLMYGIYSLVFWLPIIIRRYIF